MLLALLAGRDAWEGMRVFGGRDASSAYVWREEMRAETYADDARAKAYDCIIAYRLYHAIDMIRLYHAYIAYPDACADAIVSRCVCQYDCIVHTIVSCISRCDACADAIVSCIRLYHAYMYSDACADACRSIFSCPLTSGGIQGFGF